MENKNNRMMDKGRKAVLDLHNRWAGVAYMKEYKRRYEQLVCKKETHPVTTLAKHHRVYYMKPRWLAPGGCEYPCIPMCFQSYYNLSAHGDDDWSTDDEEGSTWAYDGDGNVKWVEYAKNQKKLRAHETIAPYHGVIEKKQEESLQKITGRVDVKHDSIMQRFYTPLNDYDIDPYEGEPLKYRRKSRGLIYHEYYDVEGDYPDMSTGERKMLSLFVCRVNKPKKLTCLLHRRHSS
jgi:hypothetical protein